jgi:hypothetical protein
MDVEGGSRCEEAKFLEIVVLQKFLVGTDPPNLTSGGLPVLEDLLTGELPRLGLPCLCRFDNDWGGLDRARAAIRSLRRRGRGAVARWCCG